jgi:hypothetical protein
VICNQRVGGSNPSVGSRKINPSTLPGLNLGVCHSAQAQVEGSGLILSGAFGPVLMARFGTAEVSTGLIQPGKPVSLSYNPSPYRTKISPPLQSPNHLGRLDRQVPRKPPPWRRGGVRGTIKTIFPLLASRSPLRVREAPACGREASQLLFPNAICIPFVI